MQKNILNAILTIGFYSAVFAPNPKGAQEPAVNTDVKAVEGELAPDGAKGPIVNTKEIDVETGLASFLKETDDRKKMSIIDYCPFSSEQLKEICETVAEKLSASGDDSDNSTQYTKFQCVNIRISWKTSAYSENIDGGVILPLIPCSKFFMLGFGCTHEAFLFTDKSNKKVEANGSGKSNKSEESSLGTPVLEDEDKGSSFDIRYYTDQKEMRETDLRVFPMRRETLGAGTLKKTAIYPYAVVKYNNKDMQRINSLPRGVADEGIMGSTSSGTGDH